MDILIFFTVYLFLGFIISSFYVWFHPEWKRFNSGNFFLYMIGWPFVLLGSIFCIVLKWFFDYFDWLRWVRLKGLKNRQLILDEQFKEEKAKQIKAREQNRKYG